MNITNHAKERYVERIQGISGKNEIKQYIAQNEDRIEDHILKLYGYSEKVFTGQIGGDKTTKDFHLSGDICLVVGDDCIRTIYRINFAFPEKTRLMVIEDLKQEIAKLQNEIQDEKRAVDIVKQDCDIKIQQAKQEIKALRESIEIKEDEIKIYESEKDLSSKKVRHSYTYLQNYAEQLLGNTEYKKDINI